jgi:hypothetical protein
LKLGCRFGVGATDCLISWTPVCLLEASLLRQIAPHFLNFVDVLGLVQATKFCLLCQPCCSTCRRSLLYRVRYSPHPLRCWRVFQLNHTRGAFDPEGLHTISAALVHASSVYFSPSSHRYHDLHLPAATAMCAVRPFRCLRSRVSFTRVAMPFLESSS